MSGNRQKPPSPPTKSKQWRIPVCRRPDGLSVFSFRVESRRSRAGGDPEVVRVVTKDLIRTIKWAWR